MNILIITQTVDTQDTTLGFFTRWIDECATHVEQVTVVCLKKGIYQTPQNVSVYSLGKEEGVSKFTYITRFFRYIWYYRSSYDVVFVHMNQEYIVLGGWLWKLLGKKIIFWRNHPYGDVFTRIAVWFSDQVMCTSARSFTAQFKKTHIMPAGVDIDMLTHLTKDVPRKKDSLLMFGRIAPIKHIEKAIDAIAALHDRGIEVTLDIVGDAHVQDSGYVAGLQTRIEGYNLASHVKLLPGVPFELAGPLYASREICLNFTPSGSFDKTVIEALACGCFVLISNESMKDIVPEGSFVHGHTETIASGIARLLSFDEEQKAEYCVSAQRVVEEQSLQKLISQLFKHI